MKRSLPSLITGIVLGGILITYMITYQVRFTEVAVVRTFGKARAPDPAKNDPGDVITEAGLNFKWPWPIQQVRTYDNRIQVTSTVGEETPTQDGKNLILTTAVAWRIDDPYTFSIRCADMEDAESKLKTRVRNDQKTVVGQYTFSQFVSTDPQELLYDEIERQIYNAVFQSARDLYGIRIESVKLEQLGLPQRITENVFEAMRKERQAVAARYTSEGESTAQQIKDTAEGIAGTIQSFADRKATEIIAEGLEAAAEYNREFAKDPELATFLVQIEQLPKILKDRTTFLLDATSAGLTALLKPGPVEVVAPTTRPAEQLAEQLAGNPAVDPLPEIVQPK